MLGDDHALDAHRDALARLHEHFGDAREGVDHVGGVLGVFDVHGVFVVAEVRLRDDAVDARLVGEDELGGEHGVVLGAPDVLRRLERVAFGALFGLGATAGGGGGSVRRGGHARVRRVKFGLLLVRDPVPVLRHGERAHDAARRERR